MKYLHQILLLIFCLCGLNLVNCRTSSIGRVSGFLTVHNQKRNIHQEKPKVTLKTANLQQDSSFIKTDNNDVSLGKQKAFQIAMQLTFSMGSWYLSRVVSKLDFNDLSVLRLSRLAFGVYILFVQLLWSFLTNIIRSRNDKTLVDVFDTENKNSLSIMTNLLGDPSKNVHNRKKHQISVKEYDLLEAKRVLSSSLPLELFGVLFIHLVFRWNTPLLLAPLSLLGSKLQSPVVQVNLLGLRAVGVLKRPFQGVMDSLLTSLSSEDGSVDTNDDVQLAGSPEGVVEHDDVDIEGVAQEEEEEEEEDNDNEQDDYAKDLIDGEVDDNNDEDVKVE